MRKLECFPWSTNDSVGHQITAECESGNGLVYKLLTPPFYLLASSNLMRSLFDTLCKVMPAQLEFCMRCYSMRWGQLNFFQFFDFHCSKITRRLVAQCFRFLLRRFSLYTVLAPARFWKTIKLYNANFTKVYRFELKYQGKCILVYRSLKQ